MAKKRRVRTTTDAVEILHHMITKSKPKMESLLEEARADGEIARHVYRLRTEAGLSQRALAKLVGTTASVICRLEDEDYDGHSLAMLRRIASALDQRVEIRFVPKKKRRSA